MTICNYCGKAEASIFTPEGIGSCPRCTQLFNTCNVCLNSVKPCEFETNPSPIPKTITKVVQKGNMRAQVELDNPDRIEAFCLTCPCWCDGCGRFSGTCGNYNEYVPSPTPDE
jgi:hypothetical protein